LKTESSHIPTWKTTTKKIVAENPFLTLEEHRREEEGTGKHGYFFIVHAPNWANIIAITENNELVLIEQFRQGSDRVELEIPGGIVDEEEAPDVSILRELTEETGYERTDRSEFKLIGEVIPNPAFIRNLCYTYLVTNVRLTGKVHFDEHENIRVQLVPRNEIEKLVTSGEIQHSLVIAAFYWMTLAGY
jgi:8-oxo-dGTP pyrophosphatase MutT (NUDIX family)